MSTLEATVAMLESMPEEAKVKVFKYTQQLFMAEKPASPFTKLSAEEIYSDLAESRQQIENGQGINADVAMDEMGKRHGFV
ncbi:MAG TPA: hypothetical protein DGX96_05415 [Lachnospiraceae bacterium]|jgi:hypothetical protein|nr:hypothetical protein [Lachnospiraceae bacterium]